MIQFDKQQQAENTSSYSGRVYVSKRAGEIFADISDLLSYFRHHAIASGIQRVQLAWIQAELDNDASRVVFTYSEPMNRVCYAVDIETLRSLIRVYMSRDADLTKIGAWLDKISGSLQIIEFSSNDIFFISGAFWNFPDCYAHFSDRNYPGGSAWCTSRLIVSTRR